MLIYAKQIKEINRMELVNKADAFAAAAHAAVKQIEDDIILFPVTGETAGLGSLAETGFSMFQAMKTNMNRYFVFMVDAECDPLKVLDPVLAKESRRARALVRAHLRKNQHPNVFVCGDLDQMLPVSLMLHRSLTYINRARGVLENGA